MNQNQKGKRIERDLVAWLKENGIESVRRTKQYNGEGLSDVVAPEELPSFHLESKGTKTSKIPRSVLKKWFKQLEDDCKGLLPILFQRPNNKDLVCLITPFVAEKLEMTTWAGVQPTFGDSFNAHDWLVQADETKRILLEIYPDREVAIPLAFAYEVEPKKVFLAFWAKDVLTYMKSYEERRRANA